ncbi:hypothetical protein [Methylocapsa aurea]|uniref:hypothetical protein n=1 Tax=Methylocapsa aurea TaxID=663610 RepID=UPI0012EB0812|nr:hypothetical protein [Methylocapsa aurea]
MSALDGFLTICSEALAHPGEVEAALLLSERPALERFPIRWNHLIEKESLKFNELEHVLIEKVDQLFRNMF